MSLRVWKRTLDALNRTGPTPPFGTKFWHRCFEAAGWLHQLDAREPDWTATLAAHGGLTSPADPAVAALHEHLAELYRRALHGVPPCSVAEFRELAAWFAANEGSVPAAERDDLRRRLARGPTAFDSGRVVERLRELRAGRSSVCGVEEQPNASKGPSGPLV